MNTLLKYAGAATLTAALALAAATPSEARDGHHAAAAIGFGAGALVGAAVASSAYNSGYYYGGGYAYEPAYVYEPAPVYSADDYAYEPRYRTRYYHNWGGSRCGGSPGSPNYVPCAN